MPNTNLYQPLAKGVATSSEKTDESTVSSSTPPPKMRHEKEKDKKEERMLRTETRTDNDFRKASTGTLNRLILVAQALENEVDSRRQADVSGSKIVFSIRMANMILLILVNILLFTGVGQYYDKNEKGHWNLMLTADKWMFSPMNKDLPSTFQEMRLNAQFFAASITVSMLLATILLQVLHVWNNGSSRLISMAYAFGAVPFSLFVFGLEMHYSACPWLEEYNSRQVHPIVPPPDTLQEESKAIVDIQCGINGWALAGIFALLSCGLFVSEGLITAFFKSESNNRDKKEAVL
ncbi:unnamed protein product, partial [Mesorhabditis belari]|uniref:Uncharacterized protein n=1 Tax=Mesorhabditis belari TaxID=2138241 RepID=A0AAF3FK04_9BILA